MKQLLIIIALGCLLVMPQPATGQAEDLVQIGHATQAVLASVPAKKPYGKIIVPPSITEYKIAKIEVESEDMPDGFRIIDVLWELSEDLDIVTVSDQLMYATGPPGTYVLSYDAVVVQDVTFTDGAGNQITLQNYKFRIKEKAQLVIEKKIGPNPPDPDPVPPDPDPAEDGPWQVMIFYHSGNKANMTLQQLAVINSQFLKDRMELDGNTLVERIDIKTQDFSAVPAAYRPFFEAAEGKALPCVVLRSKATGECIYLPFPESPDELLNWLKKPPSSQLRKAG